MTITTATVHIPSALPGMTGASWQVEKTNTLEATRDMNDMIRLVEPMIPALRRYARSLLKERAAADDIVQDCLERMVAHWHRRRADGDVHAWIFTILHNLAVSHLRQSARRGLHIPIEDVHDAAVSRPPCQEDALRHRDLLAALERLPDDLRSVLLLVSVESLSYAQAARVLDIPIGTVMSRLSRARERLEREMNREAGVPVGSMFLRRVK